MIHEKTQKKYKKKIQKKYNITKKQYKSKTQKHNVRT